MQPGPCWTHLLPYADVKGLDFVNLCDTFRLQSTIFHDPFNKISTSSLAVEEILHVDPPSAELIPLADLIFTQQMEPVLPTHDLPDLLKCEWKEKQSTGGYA